MLNCPGSGASVFTAGLTPMFVTAAPFSFGELDGFPTGHGWYSNHDAAIWIFTALVSLAFYGAAAFALYHACLNQFEIDVDRPRRFPGSYPLRVNTTGIVFVDEDGQALDGAQFVEDDGDVTGAGKKEKPFESPELS